MDQVHPDDVGLDLARRHGVEVYPSIRSALTLTPPSVGHWPTAPGWQDGELAVDGVLIVAEHGDYPIDGLERRHYPRRHFFEQVCAVFSASGRSVPVFTDKHLSYSWDGRALDVPASPGARQCTDDGWLFPARLCPHTDVWSTNSARISKRRCPSATTTHTRADSSRTAFTLWSFCSASSSDGPGSRPESPPSSVSRETPSGRQPKTACGRENLADAAESCIDSKSEQTLWKTGSPNPKVFLIEYNDGLRAATLMLPDTSVALDTPPGLTARSRPPA